MLIDCTEDTTARRFMRYVKPGPGCWEWLGSHDGGGYGKFTVTHGWQEKAHRFAYQLFVGPLEPGQLVCHHCDNPGCVNSEHLFAGTMKDNIQDAKAKGRVPVLTSCWGEDNPKHKLTLDNVSEIRCRYSEENTTLRKLAAEFGVDHSAIWKVVHHRRWK